MVNETKDQYWLYIFLDVVFPKTTVLDNPDPSRYNNTEELGRNLKGQYHLSRYRNSKAQFQPKSARFNKSGTK